MYVKKYKVILQQRIVENLTVFLKIVMQYTEVAYFWTAIRVSVNVFQRLISSMNDVFLYRICTFIREAEKWAHSFCALLWLKVSESKRNENHERSNLTHLWAHIRGLILPFSPMMINPGEIGTHPRGTRTPEEELEVVESLMSTKPQIDHAVEFPGSVQVWHRSCVIIGPLSSLVLKARKTWFCV